MQYIKLIENQKLPDIINMINTGTLTDFEVNPVQPQSVYITNNDIIIKPVVNDVSETIIQCLNFGLKTSFHDKYILPEEPENFEIENIQYSVFKYDKDEKLLMTYDLWEFLSMNNFINENFEFIVDLDQASDSQKEQNIALINNWTAYAVIV